VLFSVCGVGNTPRRFLLCCLCYNMIFCKCHYHESWRRAARARHTLPTSSTFVPTIGGWVDLPCPLNKTSVCACRECVPKLASRPILHLSIECILERFLLLSVAFSGCLVFLHECSNDFVVWPQHPSRCNWFYKTFGYRKTAQRTRRPQCRSAWQNEAHGTLPIFCAACKGLSEIVPTHPRCRRERLDAVKLTLARAATDRTGLIAGKPTNKVLSMPSMLAEHTPSEPFGKWQVRERGKIIPSMWCASTGLPLLQLHVWVRTTQWKHANCTSRKRLSTSRAA